jgi:transposase
VVDITEILVHWHAGRSISEVARSLGVDRRTVRKYVAPAMAAGIQPGGEPLSLQRWGELVREWFPELVTTELRHPRFRRDRPLPRADHPDAGHQHGDHGASAAP